MVTVVPTKTTQVDSRDGNHYTIHTVNHTTGAVSNIVVDDSAMSACEMPDDITSSAGLDKETSTSSGVTIRNLTDDSDSGLGFNFNADDGVKQVTIASAAASGTYIIVVRHVGSAAGTTGTGAANL